MHYPKGRLDAQGSPKNSIPWLFHYPGFRDDILVGQLVGIGINKQQVENIVFDFAIMVVLSMYIQAYCNPILSSCMRKVFWQFPQRDRADQWARLDEDMQKHVDWLYNPVPLTNENEYEQETSNYPRVELEK